ncbi:hypothetical protein EV192_106532 [Actinocrispum wychmicini]|uniref:Uncharacterized protein n=2 Tax=Actinocrispum wychmicini TaxID=1213861 RepID=A0A4R2JSA3_9PSEU|nr:hypothetical protein EV192_106532 [Actinocrispum wychmicini]
MMPGRPTAPVAVTYRDGDLRGYYAVVRDVFEETRAARRSPIAYVPPGAAWSRVARSKATAPSGIASCSRSSPRTGSGSYCVRMATPAAPMPDPEPIPALLSPNAPRAISDALIDEERTEFKRRYAEEMATAARTLDLTGVLKVLDAYRQIAVVTQQQGVEVHRRMLAKAAEIARTGHNPDAVPLEDMKALIRERLGR